MGEYSSGPQLPETPKNRSIESVFTQAEHFADTVTFCEPDLARMLTDELNQAAVNAGALDLRASLASPYLTGRAERFDPKSGQWMATAIDIDADITYEGSFVGFEQWRVQDRSLLMYSIELSSMEVNGRLQFATVLAPVHDAKIELRVPSEEQTETEAEKDLLTKIALLSRIREPAYRQDLQTFLGLIQEQAPLSLDRVTDLGEASMVVLGHLDTGTHQSAFQAVVDLLGHVIKPDYYYVAGHKIVHSYDKDVRHVALETMQDIRKVQGVGLVEDYGVNGAEVKLSGLLQPALRLENERGMYDYVPLLRLSDFSTTTPVGQDGCESALTRYRHEYTLEPAKHA